MAEDYDDGLGDVGRHLPHKPLYLARFLWPLKALVKEHVASNNIDRNKPDRLQN